MSYINTKRGTPLLNQETSESGAIIIVQQGILPSFYIRFTLYKYMCFPYYSSLLYMSFGVFEIELCTEPFSECSVCGRC